ncbi:MAG: hypothetical protein N3E36_07395 [Sulfolobales archaeon]|nr:hypothetical protein [Sulfolobales archaeon]
MSEVQQCNVVDLLSMLSSCDNKKNCICTDLKMFKNQYLKRMKGCLIDPQEAYINAT